MEDIKKLEDQLDYSFKGQKLIIEALTHKSYKQPYNNERLEFLGDAVLDLIVGQYLFERFPTHDEGKLSKMRASLVNEEGFTRLAQHVNLGEQLFLSNAEENNGGRSKPSLLSNAFEAIIGALYLEAGLDKTRDVSIKLLEEVHPDISLDTLFKDYKTTLQEMTQALFGTTPEYKLVGSNGPDHKKEFEIAVFVDGKEYARASGKSKKVAQQESAAIAIDLLNRGES